MKKVSIIIPIYNGEKFINRCLESILNQTYSNIELICINDGSIDSTAVKLKEYEKKDKRIICINQINSGVSIARNNGLKISTGEYITFVDISITFTKVISAFSSIFLPPTRGTSRILLLA